MLIFFIVLFLFILLIVLAFVENILCKKAIRDIPLRILVNGTRGKTTASRFIYSSLLVHGEKVMCKTTGSEAEIIYSDGKVMKTNRWRGIHINELVFFLNKARKEKVNAVVVECMALTGENQKNFSRMLNPTHVVITNSYVDHIDKIGRSEEETSKTLSLSVPMGSEVYVSEKYYSNLNANIHFVDTSSLPLKNMDDIIYPETEELCKALLRDLGLKNSEIEDGKNKIPKDIGLLNNFTTSNNSIFFPKFATNDTHSMIVVLNENKDKKIIIFNNRYDREFRIYSLYDAVKDNRENVEKILIIGDYKSKVVRFFKKRGFEAEKRNINDLYNEIKREKGKRYIGLGNIKGDGEALISLFLGEDK